MLSGVKFIQKDQLNTAQADYESDSSLEDRKTSKRQKERRKKRNRKSHIDSSDDEEEPARNRKISKKRGKKKLSSDEDSPSSSDTDTSRDRKQRKSGKKKVKRRNSDTIVSETPQLISRQEMGLEWMTKPAKLESIPDEPSADIGAFSGSEAKKDENLLKSKELNPYLKDNGTGYPDDTSQKTARGYQISSSSVGDGGASWRLKALKRAREQAAREGKKIDEIVEERWGSLGQLAASVASHGAAHAHAHLHAIKDRKRGRTGAPETSPDEQGTTGRNSKEVHGKRKDYLEDISSRHPEMRKPKRGSVPWRKGREHHSAEDSALISTTLSSINKFANDGRFMEEFTSRDGDAIVSSSLPTKVEENRSIETDSAVGSVTGRELSSTTSGLSSNQLAAKAMQLRLKGKHEEAKKLLEEIEIRKATEDNEIKIVNTNSRGNLSRHVSRETSSRLKKKEDDGDLNLAQSIIRNKQYNTFKSADDEYDFDGDAPVKKHNRKREGASEGNRKISGRLQTQKERCLFCFENPSRPKHLVVSIAQFTYMMLPRWQPVVEGHCCILPLEHESSTRTVDDNVWQEFRNFKKCLIMMFAKEEKDVIFLETVVDLVKQQRHCLVECIPLPRELAKEAPLYFKKAIDEAEDEWSQHNAKKLINTTREKGLRRSVPENFPYFHVEFGLDEGFVHVIDDVGAFNPSFGLNVVRGILKHSEEDMYRPRRQEHQEKQRLAVADFMQMWEPFDWTKQLA